jgi:1-phosphatidylinositol-3-phosphate 5-kinase
VTVVWSVKQSALEAIARCCSADIIPFIDRLALEPRLGRCASLSVETYTHALLPSARKSLMRFLAPAPTREMPLEASAGLMSGGMQAATGGAAATIVLRGGSMALLGRVKAVLDLCVYVAHNLRLEECLARDEGTQLLAPPPPPPERKLSYAQALESSAPDELCKAIERALRPYQRTLLNASAAVRLQPPYPLVKLREGHENLLRLEAERAKAEVAQIRLDEETAAAEAKESTLTPTRAESQAPQLQESQTDLLAVDDGGTSPGLSEDPDETPRAVDLDAPEWAAAAQEAPETPTRSSTKAQARPELPLRAGSADTLPALDEVLPQPSVLARETEYRIAKLEHDEAQRAWEAQEQTSKTLAPFAHQRIVTLVSVMSSATQRPCEGPELRRVEYYGQGDETLGRYLERMCSESTVACVFKGCGRPRLSHFSVYVHNEARVLVVLERFVCPIPGQEGRMLMVSQRHSAHNAVRADHATPQWSYCKRCEQASPVTPVSPDTLCLSFAKYLELHFSPEPPAKQTPCGHDFFRDHVRFFALQNLAVRFHTDAVEVRDVALPHLSLLSRPDTDGRLKSEEASTLARRMAAYFESVGTRIAALRYEANSCRDAALVAKSLALLDEMSTCAEVDATTLAKALTRTCQETEPTDVLGLSVVRRRLQEVVVRWDRDFESFEREHLPSERDVRRLTTSGLSRMFAERDPSERTAAPSIASSMTAESSLSLAPAVEVDEQAASGVDSGIETAGSRRSDADSRDAADAERFAAQLTTSLQSAALEPSSSLDELGSELPSELTSATISAASTAPPTPQIDVDPKDSDASPEDDRKPSATSTPAAWRRRRAQKFGKGDSSSTETENDSSVQQLVRRFESPEQGSSLSPTDSRSTPLRRPGLRRGKTDDATLPSQRRTAGAMLPDNVVTSGLSDGESSAAPVRQAPRALRLSGRPRSPSKPARGAAGMANSMPTSPRATEAPTAGLDNAPPTSPVARRPAARRGPPSSYRPPKHSETDSDFAGPRPRGSSASSASASRGRIAAAHAPERSTSAMGEKDTKARGSKGTLSRPPSATASRLRANPSSASSRVPVPVRREPTPGSGTVTPSGGAGRSRVSTMARHFDRLNKEAERERERQQRVLAIRARRAQPVAATHARVEVFSNVLDAVKDDESDTSDDEPPRGEADAGAVSGGEAEDEADSDAERGPATRASRREASTATITPANAAKAAEAQRSAAAGRVEGLPIVTPTSETSSLFGDQSVPASALAKTSATDRDVSLPTVTTPHSETASGSAMTVGGSFLAKTLSSLWGRGRALPLLDYPIASSEHFFADSGVVLREDEPSSLIAVSASDKRALFRC